MKYEIRERTAEQIERFKARHEGQAPDQFQLFDGDLLLSTHETQEDAELEAMRWKARDLILEKTEDLQNEILVIAQRHGLDEKEVIQTAREYLSGGM